MTRRRSSRTRRISLQGAERLLFIVGAVLYVVGLFGSVGLLPMPIGTAVLLLALGGGMQFIVTLTLVF